MLDSPFTAEDFRLYNIPLRPIGEKKQGEMWTKLGKIFLNLLTELKYIRLEIEQNIPIVPMIIEITKME